MGTRMVSCGYSIERVAPMRKAGAVPCKTSLALPR
jgi:hypothetical protein